MHTQAIESIDQVYFAVEEDCVRYELEVSAGGFPGNFPTNVSPHQQFVNRRLLVGVDANCSPAIGGGEARG